MMNNVRLLKEKKTPTSNLKMMSIVDMMINVRLLKGKKPPMSNLKMITIVHGIVVWT